MNTATRIPSSARALIAALLATLLVVSGLSLGALPASAAAATVTVTGGSLNWGVAADYRAVFATRAQAGGATLNTATDTFSFPAATSSTYDPATKTGTLNFTGNARIGYFAGAPVPGTTAGNYFYIANPVVTLNGNTGTISGTTAGDSHSLNPELPTAALASRVVANLDLSGVISAVNSEGTLITLTSVPATITEAGATALAFYNTAGDAAATKRVAGSALDALTIQLNVVAPPAPATVTSTALTAPATATVGTAAALSATVIPADAVGTVAFFDGATSLATAPVASGTASTSTTFTTAGAHAITAVFTPTDAAAFASSTSAASTVTVTAVPVVSTPTITVSKSTITDAGETVTVSGSGFSPVGTTTNASRPPLAGKFGGVYVTFGKFADVWKPSAGAASTARTADRSTLKWVVNTEDVATVGGASAGAVAINVDGTFSIQMLVKPGFTGEPTTGNYGIYTYPGGGVAYSAFETYTPVTFVPTPKVTVSKTTLTSAGETVTVTGSGFSPVGTATNAARPPLAGKFGGVYVTFGKFADTWKASEGATSAARTADRSTLKWVVNPDDVATVGGAAAGAVAIAADGTFSIDMLVKPGFSGELAAGNYGIYTYPGGGVSYAAFETYTPVTFTYPTVTVSKSTLTSAGELVTVSGSGFAPAGTATNAARPPLAGKFGGVYVTFGKFADTWKASEGATSTARTADRSTLKWVVNPEDVATVGGAAAGAVAIGADGTFSIDMLVKPGFSGEPSTGNYGIYTYPGGGVSYPAFETYSPVTFVTPPADPTPTTLALTATSPVTAGTATTLTARISPIAAGTVAFTSGGVTIGIAPVDASGVATQTTPALAAGTTSYTATFTPADPLLFAGSTNAVSVVATPVAPSTASLDWGVKNSFRDYVQGPIASGTIVTSGVTDNNGVYNFPFSTGGSYEAATGLGTSLYTGSVHFTGHNGALDIDFSDPAISVTSATSATLSVKVDGGARSTIANLDLSAASATSTATSKSFAGAPATLTAQGATAFGGFYTAGTELDTVTFTIDTTVPSVPTDPTDPTDPEVPVAPQATRLTLTATPATVSVGGSTTLVAQVAPVTAGTVTFVMGSTALSNVEVSATGSASFTVDNLPAGVQQFTAGFTPADSALYTASTATAAVSVAAAQTVGAGSLKWGVKQSFRDYVTGPIAKGAISTSGVASSGGIFTFGQSSGGNYDRATGLGTSNYSGSVRFTGHAGALDIALSNPVVRVDSATTGTLLVSVNGGASAPFATLNLAAGSRSTPDNTVSYSGVPAALTSQGAAVFSLNGSGFYSVGTALDAVSFVIGAPSAVSSTVGATVASFKAPNTAAPTPPATTGISFVTGSTDGLVAGDEVTVTASGFQPNETGILVVIYSTPTVLDTNAIADATGTVTWTGRLPAGLSGQHTLTFQGSVDRGVELTIAPAAASEAVAGCVVDDAAITWGFKESFRAYISGSIANGEWTVADGATYEVPNFGWSAGTGGYDAETGEGLLAFAGSINFTGHSGVLNTTVANPQIRFVDADSALLLLDISGTTQDGVAIDNKAVEFAELDLSGVLENDEGAVTITAAPATLTESGAAAFGTYPAGEALDPVTVTFTTAADCALPAEEESTPAVTSTTEEAVSTESPIDYGWIIWVILALVVVVAAVVITVVVRRRKA